jgi:acetolactate synthase-1/2/3 large subunit
MHQESEYPGRISATELRNPDFQAYARAFGGFGISVERTEDFPAAFQQAEASGKPAIVRLVIDPESITPGTTLAKIRAKALADKNR